MNTPDIINWLRDQAIRAPEDVLKRGMNQAADKLEELEAAARNSYTAQQIDKLRDEAYDLGVESALHHHFGLTWDDAAELRKQIAAIQEQHRWIPVTERLPEMGTHILVIENSRFSWLPEKMIQYNMFVYNPEVYQPWMEYVTHWMPLPEPPKEDV